MEGDTRQTCRCYAATKYERHHTLYAANLRDFPRRSVAASAGADQELATVGRAEKRFQHYGIPFSRRAVL
jgi:hypothetical protein